MNECNNCGSLKALIRCSGCQNRFYCNSTCQMEDWNEGNHKNFCSERKENFSPQLIPISPENNKYFILLEKIRLAFSKVRKLGRAEDVLPFLLTLFSNLNKEDNETFRTLSMRKIKELWQNEILPGMLISNDPYSLQFDKKIMFPLERFCAHSIFVQKDFIGEIANSYGKEIFDKKVFMIFVPTSFVHEFYEKYVSLERQKATQEARKAQDEFDVHISSCIQIVSRSVISDILQEEEASYKKNLIFFFCIIKGNSFNLNLSFDFARIKVPFAECQGCKKFNTKTFQCSKCKKSKYCDKKCQSEHWPIHKKDCL